MKTQICLMALKNILGRSTLSRYMYHPHHTAKLNLFSDSTNQLRLISHLHNSDFADFEKLLNKPEIQNYLKVIGEEYDKIESASNCNGPVLEICSNIKIYKSELKNLKNLNPENDKEMQKLIDSEEKNFLNEIKHLNRKLISYAIPDDSDCKSVVFSVVPGLGGQEAKLFAEELFQMYLNYAIYKDWEISEIDMLPAEGGGISRAEATITGEEVFKYLKHEAGIHRVQRVPVTEKNGKMHTSTCKINVIPDVNAGEIVLDKKDLKFDTKTSSGPGGQNVNKNETCVRVTYIPTGLTVECQTSRMQSENRSLALKKLRNLLHQEQQEEINSKMKDIKMEQGVTMKRSDKIRTYNFMQNRVTDHRINFTTHHIEKYMEGNKSLDEMVQLVNANYKLEYLLRNINRMLKQGNISELFKKKAHSRKL